MMATATGLNFRTNSAKSLVSRRARGFTLIELVVVLAIILLLLGLVMAVGLSARSQAETREMKNILLLVDNAIKEWELVSSRKLSWGIDDDPPEIFDIQGYDLNDNIVNPTIQLDQALSRIQRVDSVKQILANIDSDFLKQIEVNPNLNRPHLVDPWGQAVCLIHPGNIINVNLPSEDVDGTFRTIYENKYGVAVNRTLLLVSAGPDGKFGDLTQNQDTLEYKQAADNIYSYRPGSN